MITPLAEALDVAAFGGKAVQLGTAIRRGLPVPPGYALSPAVVEAVLREDGAAISALEAVVDELGLLAVRSSALDEDAAEASFAGAHVTVLAVSGRDAAVAAVRAVHDSARDAGAQSYRATLGLDADARMAVVLQQLVDAETAGVLFTRNPVTGADERVVEASWGLGEAVVSGLVTPDNFRVARGGALLERTLGAKDVAIRPRRDPGAVEPTEEVDVAPELVGEFCLGDRELAALDELATRCDEAYGGRAHDIEFAFRDGRVFLLQRRPITRA
jgi:pyruvate,water dikinase